MHDVHMLSFLQAPTPWFKIFTSPAVWAIIIAHTCNTWGSYTFLTCMPTYFQQALPQLQVDSKVSQHILARPVGSWRSYNYCIAPNFRGIIFL